MDRDKFMATNKKRIMVLREDGATAHMALPSAASPPDLLGTLKTKQGSAVVAIEKANIAATSTPNCAMGVGQIAPTLNSNAISDNQPENLSPESTCRGIKIILDNNNMWNEFFRSKTEMILTKQGRRMFPYCRFRISGLDPFQKYTLLMDINPVDNKRYKWTGQDWKMCGKGEAHLQRQVFIHPDSPSSGHQWMQNPVSFYKLKLTDNHMDQDGNIILHPMHRYLPHLHVVSAETATENIQVSGPDVITFTFPQTEFFAVTAYQNVRMSQFKADFNPFASGPNSWALKMKMSPSNESKKDEIGMTTEVKPLKGLNGLKSLMAAKRNSKDISAVDKGLLSADAQHLTPAVGEKISPNELKIVRGLGGLKSLMAKHSSKDTSSVHEGLITSNAVTLAGCDKPGINTDGPRTRLKSILSNEINQSPNEPNFEKTLNNCKSMMTECTSTDNSAAGQGFLTSDDRDIAMVKTSSLNESKDETRSISEQKPGKCLNNLKSLMVKRKSKDTSAVDQVVLSKDGQNVTLADSENSEVSDNRPDSNAIELKSGPCNELEKTETTYSKDFNPLQSNLRYLIDKRVSKDISSKCQGLVSCDAKTLNLIKCDESEVKDLYSSSKKSPPSKAKKDEIISPKTCKPVKNTRKYSRGKCYSQKTSSAGESAQNAPVVAIAKSAGNIQSTDQNDGSTTGPCQRNFSELIRECHLKIIRCNVEITNTAVVQTDKKGMVAQGVVVKVAANDSLGEKVGTQNNMTTTDTFTSIVKSSQSEEPVKTRVSTHNHSADEVENSQKATHSSVCSEGKRTGSHEQQQGNSKPHKRPEPVPLPLLALYLQQLKSKSRPVRTKPKPLTVSPPSLSSYSAVPTRDAVNPATNPTGQATDSAGPVKDSTSPVNNTIGCAIPPASDPVVPSTDPTDPAIVPVLPAISPTGQSTNVSKPNPDSLDLATDVFLPEPHPVLPTTNQLFIVPEPTTSRSSPMPCLSATVMSPSPDPLSAPVLSSPCQEQPSDVPVTLSLATDLTPLNSDPISNSSEVSSTPGLTNLKPESTPLLPSPDLSLSGFDPSSPASLPDLEPTLPSPATVKPMSAPSIHASSFPSLESLPAPSPFVLSSELSSQASLLGLPAPDPFLTTPYIPLLSSSHFNPLPFEGASFSSTSHPVLPALDNAQPSLPPDSSSSFQVNSEPLTRPSTPSPLPFQLSPFSSLGPDPLSPTPSLADLTHFFSISDELEITEDFPSSDATPVSCSTVPTLNTASVPVSSTLPVGSVQPVKNNKPRRSRKRSRKVSKSTTADPLPVIGGPTDVTMQPNLEEVEEQLFVSFTSKEALEVHLGEPAISETTTEQPQKTSEATNVERETTDEIIAAFEKVLLGDLKIMKHRQVIHPVLQEVGLKMSLLDPTLVIDLQYLGVRLPLPPPIPCSEPSSVELASSSPGGSVPFVSRTGKTTDFTQIKGWREKLVPLDSPSSSKAEAGPSSDVVRKNLSAFCSDMLDEYLANEGKLIDERAASFNQTAVVTPVTYQLPTKSTSYVRTLDSVLKKQAPPATFTPPSKKSRLPLASKGHKKHEKTEKRQQRPRTNQKREKASAGPTVIPTPLPIKPPQFMDNAAPVTQEDPDTNLKRRKRKPRVKSPPPSKDSLVSRPEVEVPPPAHLAPVEDDHSDPEPASAQNRVVVPGLTKALVKQRDLEDGVVWEGEHRTCITQVRATIALTSLFTSTGFVCENPTAPIKIKCRAPPCLNAFCRLGCVCASLAQDRRITHCGKIDCIFGCSCLRQKVVVLKNLKGPQFSPPEEALSKKRKKRKRMRMAYTLREAETVSEPAVRVRTLWKQTDAEIDPEPLHAPTPVHLPWIPLQEEPSSAGGTHGLVKKDGTMSCARVRVFQVKSTNRPENNGDQYEPTGPVSPSRKLKSLSHSQPFTEPSKRLEIVSDCKWRSLSDRNLVLRIVCEHMAQDHLTNAFWVKGYLIKPVSQTLKNDVESCCIHYKVHISQGPRPEGVEEENCEEEEWMREEDEETQMEEGEVEEPREDVEEGQSVKKVGEKHIVKENKTVVKRKSLKWKGLPFLNGVSPAGLLTANLKLASTSDQELVTVNGRSYPHAKIQLGRMGAIHPANRLAAFLTERLQWPVGLETSMSSHENPSATAEDFEGLTNTSSSMEQPAQLAASLTTSVATVTTTNVATVTTTSVSSDTPVAASPKSIVTHLPQAGEDFTRFVVKQISSSQPRLPLTSDPSKSLGSILQPGMPSTPLSTSLVEAASSRSSSDPSSTGDDGSSRKTFPCAARVIRIPAPSTTVRIQCPPPPPSTNPSSPLTSPRTGQRVVLQQVRSTSGATLFRNPSGQLIQLVPLSQLQALNPNLVMRNTGGMISLTTPACLASGSTAAVTSSPSTTSHAAPPSKGPVSMASTITSAPLLSVSLPKLPTSTAYTSIAPKATPHQVTASLPGSKLFHAGTVSLSPAETNGETYSLKIVSQTGNKEPIIIKCPKVPNQGPSKVLPVVGGLTVLEPPPKFTVITVITPTKNVPDTGVKADSVSTVDTGVDPKVTSEVYSWRLPCQKSTPTPTTAKSPMSVKAPISHQFKFIKSNTVTAVPKIQSEVVRVLQPIPKLVNPPLSPVKKTAVKANTIFKMNLNVNTPKVVGVHHPLQMCARPQKKKELEALDMTEDEDDSDSTDGETDEKTDNSSDNTDSSDSTVNKEDLIDVINKQLHHNVLERNRRHELQERFNRLRDSLQMDQKASKVSILENAKEKIEDLTKRSRNEEKLKESLTLKRDAHLKKMSHLTGASEEQILRNIQYVSQEKVKTLHGKSEYLGTKVSSAVSSPSVDTTCIESEPKPSPSPPAGALSKDNTKETQEMNSEEVMEVVDLCEDTQDVIEVVDLLEDREEVMEVVDLREDPEEEEKTDNSSDETEDSEDDNRKNKDKGDVINISDVEESSVQEMAVDIETVEDKTHESITPHIEAKVTKEVEGAVVPKFENWGRYLRNRGVELRKSLKALKETLVLDEPAPIDEVVLGQAGKRVHDLRNECELLEKQKNVLNKEKTTPKSGKKYELIRKKLRDISTKQKNMANGKGSEVSLPASSSSTQSTASSSTPPSALSSTPPNTTISTSSTKSPDPKFPALKLKVVSAPVPPQLAPQQSKMSPLTTPPTKNPAARWRPLNERTRPNILSRKKPQPPPDLPRANSGFLPPQMLSIVGGVVPCQQVITMSPLHPPGSLLSVGRVTGMEMQQSLTPGVASVTISIPSMSQPISLTPPSNVHNRGVPHIANVISLVNVPPVQAVPGVSGGPQRRLSPVKSRGSRLEQGKVLEKQSRAVEINTGSTHESEDEEGGEDDTLKSLLSEIVFLNQLTNDSSSDPGGPAVVNCTPLTEPVEAGTDRETSPHPEKEVIRDGDDERSLSPLFLRLDEDLLGPKEGKGPDEVAIKGLPQPQDLKVCLGAHLKPSEGSGASAAVNGHSPQLKGLARAAKGQGGALTPPPLLQMKVGGGTKVIESNEKPVDTLAPPPLVQMRPMPKLTPLGLKSNSPM
ncbi:MAX dimerization protein MGA a isoform X2 [Esox lucius]|uniref:T-box domain-containing protein n=1 Tax=Esox lucius TaxID=8010 RepID=A0A3P8X9P6_ESOLU|nr:MAX dimerization protein MGA a isoform X2 [Esox lucius]